MKQAVKHLFCDVDGVLLHGFSANPALHRGWDETIDVDLGICQKILKELFFQKRFSDVILGKTPLESALQGFLEEIQSPHQPKTIIEYWLQKDSVIFHPMLEWVRAFPLNKENKFIATNQEHHRARHLWTVVGFEQDFSEIFYSAQLGFSKSQPKFFQGVIKQTGFNPENCLFIDDSKDFIACAASCGWQTVLFEGMHSLKALDNVF